MSKIENINYCRLWNRVCSSFADVEYQKKCWFRMEGPEVSSFGEDFTLMDTAWKILDDSDRDHYLNNECNVLIRQFMQKLHKYRENPQTDFILIDEDELYKDPKWIEITQLAKKTQAALEKLEGELNHV